MHPSFAAFALAIIVGSCLSSVQALAADPLPKAAFRLSCLKDERTNIKAETYSILALLAFAQAHDGEPVYLDAVIEADAGTGFCSRDLAALSPGDADNGKPSRISFNGCDEERNASCLPEGVVRVDADGPPLAYRHSILLPAEASLPKNLPYRMGGYGDWLNYQGPFIARYYEGTGYAYATFHVPDAALGHIWERAAETPKRIAHDE